MSITPSDLVSWLVLCDAEKSIPSFFSPCYASDFRIGLVSCLTLLRGVGHVLHKVDCEKHPEISHVVNTKYSEWKRGLGRNAIFKDFINGERNNIIKTYQFPVPDAMTFIDENGAYEAKFDRAEKEVMKPSFPESLSELRESCIEAVEWWKTELEAIAESANGK